MHKRITRGLTAMRLELGLIIGHWSFWLIAGLWSAFLAYTGYSHQFGTLQAALKADIGNFGIGLLSLVALFLTGASASRPQRIRFSVLDAVLPTGAEVLIGRWLASLAASCLLLLPVVVVAIWRGSLVGFWSSLPVFAAESGLTLAFCTAAAYWLVTRFSQRRWVYPLLGIGWLLFLALPHLPLFDRTSTGMRGMTLLSFMRMETVTYDELWGQMVHGGLPTWFNGFYLGCTALLIAGVIRYEQQNRRRRTAAWTWLALIVAVSVAGGSAVGFWQTTAALASHESANSRCSDPLIASTAKPPVQIAAYTINADLREPSAPAFRAKLVLSNQAATPINEVVLTLQRDLLISEASVAFEQQDDRLLLRLPTLLAANQSLEVDLAYAGNVLLTGSFSGPPQAIYFSNEQGVRLASAGAWYPLVGEQLLQPLCRNGLHAPAVFELAVQAPNDWQIVSNLDQQQPNLWRSNNAQWAFLLAVPGLVNEQVGSVNVITMPEYLDLVRPYALRYQARLEQLARFFPAAAHDRMTLAVLDAGEGLPMNAPAADHPFIYQRWERLSEHAQNPANEELYLTTTLVNSLWQRDPSQAGNGARINPIQRQVDTFLGQLLSGDPAKTRERVDAYYRTSNKDIDPALYNPIVFGLVDSYEQQGAQGVIRLITKLQQEQNQLLRLSQAQLAEWLEQASHEN
ncbi:hypothetical protein [Herpetosiphon sp. NSE202]|uniref:hypothetical protein n=1 Tax=Herpetosiphon sp. NSE202 TaxID=3351349 RepID=UPI00363B268E